MKLYHVRHRNGCTVDMVRRSKDCNDPKSTALKLAREENAQCFELIAGKAKLIFSPALVKYRALGG